MCQQVDHGACTAFLSFFEVASSINVTERERERVEATEQSVHVKCTTKLYYMIVIQYTVLQFAREINRTHTRTSLLVDKTNM